MKYSTNYNMDLPEIAEQYNIKHMNKNTEIIDTQMKNEETERKSESEALRNITDSVLKKAIINLAYRKGTYYWTSDETFDPNVEWGVGTWIKVEDKMIMAKGSTFASNGGNSNGTITLDEGQLPSHSHGKGNLSMDGQGGHSHTRGTMNITGTITTAWTDSTPTYNGAFRPNGKQSGYFGWTGSHMGRVYSFDASNSWTGSTNEVPAHTHNISGSTASVGNNQPINIMPPYEVAYCWKRTE